MKIKNKIIASVTAGFVGLGLLLGAGGAPALAAASSGISQPTLNNCQWVTKPPKVTGIACWNFGFSVQPPEACRSTRVWTCYRV